MGPRQRAGQSPSRRRSLGLSEPLKLEGGPNGSLEGPPASHAPNPAGAVRQLPSQRPELPRAALELRAVLGGCWAQVDSQKGRPTRQPARAGSWGAKGAWGVAHPDPVAQAPA